jgi:ATPase family associated with various cellular activities (AAA)
MTKMIANKSKFIRQERTYSHVNVPMVDILGMLNPPEYYSTSSKLTTLIWTNCFITMEYSVQHFSIVIYADSAIIHEKFDILDKQFNRQSIVANWIIDAHGSSVQIPISMGEIHQEAYPYITDIYKYADDFFNSSSNILLLPGDPGTGKTNFIKFLISTQRRKDRTFKVYLSYSEKMIDSDYFFSQFLEDPDSNILLLEDVDTMIAPREDGNSAMVKVLNAGDGIISLKKKIIISTNIKNESEMDSALIRPGRCYDVLHFRELTYVEAETLSKVIGVDMPETKKENYTLAEIYSGKTTNTKPKIGF